MRWNNNGIPRPSSPRFARRDAINTEGVKRDVIVIGASAGGVMALEELFRSLPARLPAANAGVELPFDLFFRKAQVSARPQKFGDQTL